MKMGSAAKSIIGCEVAVLVLLVVTQGTQMARAQSSSCSNQLSNLNVCAPYVVPGAAITNPSATCCTALQAIDPNCLCNTIRISSQLPSQCQIPPLSCGI
ncbi:Protein MEN-8, partial [Mucuna pruriens]